MADKKKSTKTTLVEEKPFSESIPQFSPKTLLGNPEVVSALARGEGEGFFKEKYNLSSLEYLILYKEYKAEVEPEPEVVEPEPEVLEKEVMAAYKAGYEEKIKGISSKETIRTTRERAIIDIAEKWFHGDTREAADYIKKHSTTEGTKLEKKYTFKDLIEAQVEPVAWLIDRLLPGMGLTLFIAPPKAGKSYLCLQMALHVASGRDFFGRHTEKAGVLYFETQGSANYTTRNRLIEARKIGIANDETLENIQYFRPEKQLTWEEIKKTISESTAKMVVLDMASTIFPVLKNDSYQANSMAINAIDDFARAEKKVIIGTWHTRKINPKERDLIDLENIMQTALGSSALWASCSDGLALLGKKLFIVPGKAGGESAEITLHHVDDTGFFETGFAIETLPPVQRKVVQAIQKGKTKNGDIATATGMDTGNCSKHLKALMHKGVVGKDDEGTYFLLIE